MEFIHMGIKRAMMGRLVVGPRRVVPRNGERQGSRELNAEKTLLVSQVGAQDRAHAAGGRPRRRLR